MSKRRTAYPPEFRRQMVELVRSGRNPEDGAERAVELAVINGRSAQDVSQSD